MRVLLDTVRERGIDVVLPTHEQAWLLAAAHELLPADLPVALAPIGAFDRVQSKVAFARLLDELALPQPEWRTVRTEGDLDALRYPYWLKAAHSTAGQGVARACARTAPSRWCSVPPHTAARAGAVLAELTGAALRRDHYRASREALTPVLRDPPSAAPLVFVLARALFSPARATRLARDTVVRYSIAPETVARVSRAAPRV